MAISDARDWRAEDPASRIEMTTTRTETLAGGRLEPQTSAVTSSGGTARQVAGGGSALEALGGVATVVLAIIALAAASTTTAMILGAIIAIVIGASLLMQGASQTAQFARGISGGFAGGAAGIVLGILALVGLVPMTLLAVTAIVFGAATLLAGVGVGRMNAMGSSDSSIEQSAVAAAAGTLVLAGLAAIVLGIVAIVGTAPLTLTLVAYLCLGCSVLMCGSAMTGRVMQGLRR